MFVLLISLSHWSLLAREFDCNCKVLTSASRSSSASSLLDLTEVKIDLPKIDNAKSFVKRALLNDAIAECKVACARTSTFQNACSLLNEEYVERKSSKNILENCRPVGNRHEVNFLYSVSFKDRKLLLFKIKEEWPLICGCDQGCPSDYTFNSQTKLCHPDRPPEMVVDDDWKPCSSIATYNSQEDICYLEPKCKKGNLSEAGVCEIPGKRSVDPICFDIRITDLNFKSKYQLRKLDGRNVCAAAARACNNGFSRQMDGLNVKCQKEDFASPIAPVHKITSLGVSGDS